MKAKKILAGVCASLMLATAAVPAVSAADSVKVTVGSAKAKAGAEFSVTVDLADIPAAGINGCDFGIKFDSSVISITGVEKGALAKDDTDSLDGVNSLETNVGNGLVSIVYGVSGTTVTGSGTFVTLKGKVSSSAAAGSSSKLEVVAIDRQAKPQGSETNADIIFGVLGSDNKTFTNYVPTIVNGLVEVEGEATQPTTQPTEPTTQPTEPTTQPTEPTTQPTEPTTQYVEPTQPTTQYVEPTQPTTQYVEPTQPTSLYVEPTQPTTQYVAPTQPTTGAPDIQPTTRPSQNVNPAQATKLGDVDLNGLVELNDIIVLAKHLLNKTANPLNEQQMANADVTLDLLVNSGDLSKIIEHNLNPAKVQL